MPGRQLYSCLAEKVWPMLLTIHKFDNTKHQPQEQQDKTIPAVLHLPERVATSSSFPFELCEVSDK